MIRIHVRQLDLVIIRRRYLIARRIDNLLNLVTVLGLNRDGSITAILHDGIAFNRTLSANNGGSHTMERRRKRIHDWFAIRSLLRRAVLVRGLLGKVNLNLVILHNARLIHVARIEFTVLHRLGRQGHEQRTQQHAEQINLRRRVVLNGGRSHARRRLFYRERGGYLRSCLPFRGLRNFRNIGLLGSLFGVGLGRILFLRLGATSSRGRGIRFVGCFVSRRILLLVFLGGSSGIRAIRTLRTVRFARVLRLVHSRLAALDALFNCLDGANKAHRCNNRCSGNLLLGKLPHGLAVDDNLSQNRALSRICL